jgi:hypothetical protein
MDYLTQLNKEVKLVVEALWWLVENNDYGRSVEDFDCNRRAFLLWTLEGMDGTDDEIRETIDAIMSLDRQTRG